MRIDKWMSEKKECRHERKYNILHLHMSTFIKHLRYVYICTCWVFFIPVVTDDTYWRSNDNKSLQMCKEPRRWSLEFSDCIPDKKIGSLAGWLDFMVYQHL